jgi:hypothetical protein
MVMVELFIGALVLVLYLGPPLGVALICWMLCRLPPVRQRIRSPKVVCALTFGFALAVWRVLIRLHPEWLTWMGWTGETL